MRPRTKLQGQIYSLSKELPKITEEQKQWAFKNCLSHVAYRTKTNVSCLDCGNTWDGPKKAKKCVCPSCGISLTISDTRKKKFDQTNVVMAIMDVIDGFQLVRFFQISSYQRSGWIAKQHIWEIVQLWFKPNEKLTIVAKVCSYGNTGFSGDMEIRNPAANYYGIDKYNLYAEKIYPKFNCLPIYKRNGFSAKIQDLAPYSFLRQLLNDSTIETLIKSKQYTLASHRAGDRRGNIDKYWRSIKICIRNKYTVTDAITWLDYLDLLVHFKKDILNPKYICPKNLKLQHDRLVDKKMAPILRAKIEQERQNIELAEKTYLETKAAFFGIVFSKGNLSIKVLESIKEFIEEGVAHKHCVYTNAYYQKADSLILSARIGNKPIETIEISLSKMKVVQSRGKGNNATQYNKDILDLVNKNIPVIKKKYLQLKKKAA